ncbi:MAG: hypothetical protein KC561_14085 [Myxococcales bacterium]|nr:hypothetical protein [Myxococcales bacterium]
MQNELKNVGRVTITLMLATSSLFGCVEQGSGPNEPAQVSVRSCEEAGCELSEPLLYTYRTDCSLNELTINDDRSASWMHENYCDGTSLANPFEISEEDYQALLDHLTRVEAAAPELSCDTESGCAADSRTESVSFSLNDALVDIEFNPTHPDYAGSALQNLVALLSNYRSTIAVGLDCSTMNARCGFSDNLIYRRSEGAFGCMDYEMVIGGLGNVVWTENDRCAGAEDTLEFSLTRLEIGQLDTATRATVGLESQTYDCDAGQVCPEDHGTSRVSFTYYGEQFEFVVGFDQALPEELNGLLDHLSGLEPLE